jgi:hypothetical protein
MKAKVPPTPKPKPSRPNEEFNAGARAAERRVLRYLRGLRDTSEDPIQDLEGAIVWVENMAERSAKRAGGQGRK